MSSPGNVTAAERERIRELFLQGVRVVEICRRTGRSESSVYRVTRGLPRPKSRATKRDELVVQRVLEEGVPMEVVARQLRLTLTRVCRIVGEAEGVLPLTSGGYRPRMVPTWKRAKVRPQAVEPAALNRERMARRNDDITRLVVDQGMSRAVVARRYGISVSRVGQIARQRSG